MLESDELVEVLHVPAEGVKCTEIALVALVEKVEELLVMFYFF